MPDTNGLTYTIRLKYDGDWVARLDPGPNVVTRKAHIESVGDGRVLIDLAIKRDDNPLPTAYADTKPTNEWQALNDLVKRHGLAAVVAAAAQSPQ